MVENINQSSPKGNKTGLIILILAAVIVIAGGLWYALAGTDENTNNENNTNTVANENANTNVNTNTAANTNAETNSNTNTATNTNSSVDTSDWLTYTNEEYGFSFKYPQDWKQEYIFENDSTKTVYEKPLQYSLITSADGNYELVLGVKRTNDKGTIYYRTGIGAGDISEGDPIIIMNTSISTWKRVFEDKVVEIFLFPVEEGVSPNIINNHEVIASFSIVNSDTLNSPNLVDTNEYRIVLSILQSLEVS